MPLRRWCFPIDPREAFDLLLLFSRPTVKRWSIVAIIDFEVTCAFERAVELIERAATSVPRADVVAALVPLMGDDRYGVRAFLDWLVIPILVIKMPKMGTKRANRVIVRP